MEVNELVGALQACLSPDPGQRNAGEQALQRYQYAPRQCVNLLQAVVHNGLELQLRQAASIQFKQTVAKAWEPKEEGSACLGEEDKAVIRQNLLESIIQTPPLLRSQLGETLKAVVECDYPEKWPDLLATVCQNLAANEHARVHGALYALRIMARKYEFKDDEQRRPIQELVNTTFPVILQLLQNLMASNSPAPEVGELMKLVQKTFWSCTFLDLPDLLMRPEVFQQWMLTFHALIMRPVPEEGQPTDPEHRRNWSWWKCKKWVLHIVNRLYSRFSETRSVKKDKKALAQAFVKDYAPRFLEACMTVIGTLTTGAYLPDRVVNQLIQYLTSAVAKKDAYRTIKPHLPMLLYQVVFPLLCFNDEDAELWAEDPHEYVRKGYDVIEDMYSPRTAALNFVGELIRRRGKETMHSFLEFLVQIFNACAATVPMEQRPYAQMDGAMLAVGSLAEKLKNSTAYKGAVEPMLTRHILPEFGNPRGHIRAKACWVAGQFSDFEFAQPENFTALFRHVVGALRDPDLPVRVDAVVALRSFVEATQDLDELRSILPQLLDEFFRLMNEVENEDLVFTLETIVEKFGEEISPYAVGLTQNLVQAFWKCLNSEEEDEDDVGALASVGCLRAISTVLESVSSLPQLYPELERILMPVMTKMMSSNGQDVYEEVLELVSYITYFGPSVSPEMWSLWPLMIASLNDWAISYFENVMVPLDNYISRGTDVFVTSRNPHCLQQTYDIVRKVLTDRDAVSDQDAVAAPKLVATIFQNCRGRVDEWVEPYVLLALERYPNTEKRGLKDLLLLTLANVLYYNPVLTVNTLQRHGMLGEAFRIWTSMLAERTDAGKRVHFKKEGDKKMCCLAIVSLLALPAEALPLDLQAGMPSLMSIVLELLLDLKKQIEEREKREEDEDNSDDEEEDEGDDEEDVDDVDDDEDGDGDGGEESFFARMSKFNFSMGDDSDSDWDDDDEVTSPVDNVDPFVIFHDTFMSVSQSDAARFQALTGNLDENARAAAQALLAHANVRREQMVKETAEREAKEAEARRQAELTMAQAQAHAAAAFQHAQAHYQQQQQQQQQR